jgi:hypothetical protein
MRYLYENETGLPASGAQAPPAASAAQGGSGQT